MRGSYLRFVALGPIYVVTSRVHSHSMKRTLSEAGLERSTMAPSADHEGFSDSPVEATTTVVVVGAGPSGLMLA